jgi:hypothetical protein
MKEFEVEVTVRSKFKIQIDENVYNEKSMEEWRKFFFDFHDLEEHAAHIAQHKARHNDRFIEGYGIPLVNGKVPPFGQPDELINKDINVIVEYEDEVDTDVIEIEEE